MTFYVFWQRKPLQVSTCHELGVSIFLTLGVQNAKFLFYPVKENIQQPGLFFLFLVITGIVNFWFYKNM